MGLFDEESPFGAPPRPAATHHEIGQLLDLLSIAELQERIATLKSEVARLEGHIAAKQATRHAADALFKS